ncbi:hypothetical protein D5R40_16345, partial [Okeania hirsuta]
MHSQLNLETTLVENLQQAETYLAKGKLDIAQTACQKVLVALPDFAPGYNHKGVGKGVLVSPLLHRVG